MSKTRKVILEVIVPAEQQSWRVAATLHMAIDSVIDVRVVSSKLVPDLTPVIEPNKNGE